MDRLPLVQSGPVPGLFPVVQPEKDWGPDQTEPMATGPSILIRSGLWPVSVAVAAYLRIFEDRPKTGCNQLQPVFPEINNIDIIYLLFYIYRYLSQKYARFINFGVAHRSFNFVDVYASAFPTAHTQARQQPQWLWVVNATHSHSR